MPIMRRHLIGAALSLSAPHVARAARRNLTVAAPTGIFQTNYEAAVIDPFRRKNPDIEVTYYPAAASEQILSLLRTRRLPPVDVALLELTVARTATSDELLVPLTAASLPGVELPASAFTQGVAGPAVLLDCLGIAYSPQHVAPPPTSWRALWSKGLTGEIVLVPAPDWSGVAFTLVANALFGGDDYRRSLRSGINSIAIIAPGVSTWYPIPDIYSVIIDGSASIGVAWNAQGQMRTRDSGGKLAMAIPIEGSIFQVTTINLAASAKDTEAARSFIAYALGAEAQQAAAERLFYTPVNAAVELDSRTLARTASSPERRNMMMEVDWRDVAAMRDRIAGAWRERIMVRR